MMKTYGTDEEAVLRSLIRRVDKHLTYQIRQGAEPDSLLLTLRQGKLSGELQVRVDDIRDSNGSLTARETLRQRIKRARDTMWETVARVPLQSARHKKPTIVEGNSFFRKR